MLKYLVLQKFERKILILPKYLVTTQLFIT